MTRIGILIVIAISQFATVSTALGSDGLRTVRLSLTVPPSFEPGITFRSFGPSMLNDSGSVGVLSILQGSGVVSDNDVSAWSEPTGTELTLIAREDSAVPIGPGVFFNFSIPSINNAGQAMFSNLLRGDGVNSANRLSIWRHTGSEIVPVVRSLDHAVGVGPDAVFRDLAILGSRDPVFNDQNQTAFHATYSETSTGSTAGAGIWIDRPGTGLGVIAHTGISLPQFGPAATFGTLFSNPVLNPQGDIMFVSSLTNASAGVGNAVWRYDNNGLAPIAVAGSPASDTGPGTNYGSFVRGDIVSPAINSQAETAFRGTLVGTNVNNNNDTGIWSEGGAGGLHLVAREGAPAPGADTRFADFFEPIQNGFSEPSLSDAGDTAFRAELTGPNISAVNDIGIWVEELGSELKLLARKGHQAPGLNPGVNFDRLDSLMMNSLGQTLFSARVRGPGIQLSTNDYGIWAQDVAGNLCLVVRTGDTIDVSDDPNITDLRLIRELGFYNKDSGGSDGRLSYFNNRGQITFSAVFTGGSQGVFVTNRVAVPEPSGVSLLLAAFGAILVRGKMRCRESNHDRYGDSPSVQVRV